MDIKLIKMQPSRKKPKSGDVFIIQPRNSLFFYGKVIKASIPSKDPFVNGWNLIYIYKSRAKDIVMPSSLDPKQLLVPPQIINNQGWLKGYFQTIGSLTVTKEELATKYGFWDSVKHQFVNEERKILEFKPAIWTDYGLGSYGVVSYDINRALDENPELLE